MERHLNLSNPNLLLPVRFVNYRPLFKYKIEPYVYLIYLLLPFRFVVCRQIIKQFTIHLHERFKHIIDEGHDGLVPVLFGDFIECREHDGKDHTRVLLYQLYHVVVVPVVEGTLSNLNHKQDITVDLYHKHRQQP